MRGAPVAALRRCLLAVAVLDDVDVVPAPGIDGGVVLRAVPAGHCHRAHPVRLGWAQIAAVLDGLDAESDLARRRLSRWLHLVRWLTELPEEMLADLACLIGLPSGHALHPGAGWPVGRVLGGAIDVGLAVAGLDPERSDDVVVVPPMAAVAAGVDTRGWLRPAGERLSLVADLAARRRRHNPEAPLRPYGHADVLTLLAGRALREQLARAERDGLALVAAPVRTRGWTRLSWLDPAYIPAAYAATEPEQRGLPRALLVTADEVVQARPGRPAQIVLRDPAPAEPLQMVVRR